MKKLINDPADVVTDALHGVEAAHPELRVDHANKIIYRADAPVQGKVGIISGGGSGHEPLHGGFVGRGMLDAACAGEMFTSPVPDQMLEATKGVDGGAGVLHIVKNYTGDVMNFDMAAELAAAETGVEVAAVVTADDVAVQDSLYTAGRRGVGVTVLVEKIAGAAAEERRSLAEVAAVARHVSESGRSMGVALTSCTVPAVGHPTFDLPEDQIEVGIGIHGEPGRRRIPLAPAREIAELLVTPVLDDLDFTGSDGVLAFLNGMGGTPLIELYLMYGEVARLLEKAGVTVQRSLVGSYITSLDMAGCSLTLLNLDAGTAPAVGRPRLDAGPALGQLTVTDPTDAVDAEALTRWIRRFAELVAEHRDELTALDAAIGDADHGTNMDRGMTAVVDALASDAPPAGPGALLKQAGMTLVRTVGGASGPLYGTFFLRMATAIGDDAVPVTPEAFAKAIRAGLEGIVARGKAEAGDKTMFDALAPAVDALEGGLAQGGSLPAALGAASAAADAGRDATIPLHARKGRASYLGERSVGHQDPGATSAALLMTAAAQVLPTGDA